MDYSFNSIIERNNTILNSIPTVGSNGSNGPNGGSNNSLRGVRVISIVLDETHPRFEELGQWSALGAIMYDEISPSNNFGPGFLKNNILDYPVAYPINSSTKHYPLLNEIVYITNLPNNTLDFNPTSTKQYYVDIVNLWNSPHHNAYPIFNVTPSSEVLDDYLSAESGLNVQTYNDIEGVSMSKTELGSTFVEKSDIYPLLPYEGDVIYEGRWGNSIRLGSTVNSEFLINKNTWSSGFYNNGDPIVIIRNGQGTIAKEGWKPIVENINLDLSSIYLTSTQKLNNINESFNQLPNRGYSVESYTLSDLEPPISLQNYSNPQIVLNSDRIVLNSIYDNVIINSPLNNIHLSCKNGFLNFDSTETIINSNKIFLGTKSQSGEPVVLGLQLLDILKVLITVVYSINTSLTKAKTDPIPGANGSIGTMFELNASAEINTNLIKNIVDLLGDSVQTSTILSKNVFTK